MKESHKLNVLFWKLRDYMGDKFPFSNEEAKRINKILNEIRQVYYLFKYPYPNKEITPDIMKVLTCEGVNQGNKYKQINPAIPSWLEMKSGDAELNYLDVIKVVLNRLNKVESGFRKNHLK